MANIDLITFHFATVDVCEPEPNPVRPGDGGGTKRKRLFLARDVYSHGWASAAVIRVLEDMKFILNSV